MIATGNEVRLLWWPSTLACSADPALWLFTSNLNGAWLMALLCVQSDLDTQIESRATEGGVRQNPGWGSGTGRWPQQQVLGKDWRSCPCNGQTSPAVLESPILAPFPVLTPRHCCPFTGIFHYSQVPTLAGCKHLQERGRSHKRHLSPALLEGQWSRSWPCWSYRGKGVVFGITGGYDQVCFSLEAQSSLRTIFLADLLTDQQSLHQSRHWNPPEGLL